MNQLKKFSGVSKIHFSLFPSIQFFVSQGIFTNFVGVQRTARMKVRTWMFFTELKYLCFNNLKFISVLFLFFIFLYLHTHFIHWNIFYNIRCQMDSEITIPLDQMCHEMYLRYKIKWFISFLLCSTSFLFLIEDR